MNLVSVMVAVGISSIMMTAFTNMAQYTNKIQAEATINNDILTQVNNLRMVLAEPARATLALTGNTYNDITRIADPFDTTKSLAFNNQKYNKYSIRSIQVTNVAVPSRAGLYKFSITLAFNKSVGVPIVRRNVTDVYCLVVSNVITQCLGAVDTATLAQQTCTSMNGVWNVSGACTLKTDIPVSVDCKDKKHCEDDDKDKKEDVLKH